MFKLQCSKNYRRKLRIIICIGFLSTLMILVIYKLSFSHQRPKNFDKDQFTELTTTPKPEQKNSTVRFPYPTYIVSEAYRFLTSSDDLCYGNGYNVTMVMLVPSSLDHFDCRQAIRKTWGSVTKQQSPDLRLGFVVGITENKTMAQLILQESEQYGDIIEANFMDTYENLTFKSFMIFKWFSKFCYNAKYLLKVDDDVFINIPNLLEMLKEESFENQENFISGYLISGVAPIRDESSKYYVSEEEYANDTYPKYIAGSAYVTSGSTAIKLYLSSIDIPLLSMEDVFFTGLCAERIAATHIASSKFFCFKPSLTVSNFANLISTNGMTAAEMVEIWAKLNESSSNSTAQ